MIDTQREFLIIKDNAKDGEIQLSLRQMEVRHPLPAPSNISRPPPSAVVAYPRKGTHSPFFPPSLSLSLSLSLSPFPLLFLFPRISEKRKP